MEAINGDKLRGHLEAMVLSTLERGEAHGLEILRRLEEAGCDGSSSSTLSGAFLERQHERIHPDPIENPR